MVRKEDVERLVSANERVRELLTPREGNPLVRFARRLGTQPGRKAAQVICDEFGWLIDKGSYWEGLQEASERLREHREHEAQLLREIASLLDQEQGIFRRLGIDDERSGDVLSHAYSGLRIVGEYEEASPDSLANLRDRLSQARELICAEAHDQIRRVYDKLIGHRGAQVLGGASVAGANVAIAIVDQGTVSWVSLQVGYHIMRGDIEALIKILKGGDQ